MQRTSPAAPTPTRPRNDWATLSTLVPYLWVYKWRVVGALVCLVGAKAANIGVPLVMKMIIDTLSVHPDQPHALLVLQASQDQAPAARSLDTVQPALCD